MSTGAGQSALERPLHELRGAVAAIGLGISLLQQRGSHHAQVVEGVLAQLERAHRGLDELEDARIGRVPASASESVELSSFVLDRVRSWSRLAPAFGASLEVDWRAGAVWAEVDSPRLACAFDNLIANALEHGRGRVLVEGRWSNDVLSVRIRDGGPGPESVPAQTAPSDSRRPRGRGLTIAVGAITANGGTVRAERTAGEGSVVVELTGRVAGPAEALFAHARSGAERPAVESEPVRTT